MTNAEIVMRESIDLMKAGIIGTTGRIIKMVTINEDGEEQEIEVNEPEPIHTYATWKQMGYQVQKGEKAVAQFTIWKHVTKKGEMQGKNPKTGEIVTEEYDDSRMFMKKASWFKFSQVAPIEQ